MDSTMAMMADVNQNLSQSKSSYWHSKGLKTLTFVLKTQKTCLEYKIASSTSLHHWIQHKYEQCFYLWTWNSKECQSSNRVSSQPVDARVGHALSEKFQSPYVIDHNNEISRGRHMLTSFSQIGRRLHFAVSRSRRWCCTVQFVLKQLTSLNFGCSKILNIKVSGYNA